MFDLIRNLGKTPAEKRQESLTAYLDNALTPRERQDFERQLAAQPALRAALDEQRLVKQRLRQLPRVTAPRHFTLDPAVYGRPALTPARRAYPIMRAATAVMTLLFVFLLALDAVAPLSRRPQAVALEATAPPTLPVEEVAAGEDAAPLEMAVESAEEETLATESISEAELEPAPAATVASDVAMLAPAPTTTPEPALAAGAAAQSPSPAEESPSALDNGTDTFAYDATTAAQARQVATEEAPPDADAASPATTATEAQANMELTAPPAVSLLQWAQIAAGSLVAVMLLVTLWLRRRH